MADGTNLATLRLPQANDGEAPERAAAGKALRKTCPRSWPSAWKPVTRRADPIDLLIANSQDRQERLLPLRYARMMASPFAFYRGAAAIMAYDLSSAPRSGPSIVICGDAHLMNFGGFATPERRLIFDVNDFDEASIGPWEWDVARLAASFHIAAAANGFNDGNRDAAAWAAAHSYHENMARYAEMPVLEAHYEFIDLDKLVAEMADTELRQYTKKEIAKATEQDAHRIEFAKLAHVAGDQPRIRDEPPLIFHFGDLEGDATFRRNVEKMLARYRNNLPPERRSLLDRFVLKDVAMKVVGVGSVGTRCGIALMMAPNDDVLFLQFKEARASVLEAYVGAAPFKSAGERVVFCQRLMQSASDIFLAPTVGPEGRQFYIRQLRDAKVSPNVAVMNPKNLVNYAKVCGWALARAHNRSADPVLMSGYLGGSEAFEDAMVDFARTYAVQNEADHAALVAAVRSGRIDAKTEEG